MDARPIMPQERRKPKPLVAALQKAVESREAGQVGWASSVSSRRASVFNRTFTMMREL